MLDSVTSSLAQVPSIAGGGRFQNDDILLDSIDNNTTATAGGIGVTGINYTPSIDAIFESKINTTTTAPSLARSAGTIVSTTTKSGANTLSGDCRGFLRNDAMDAKNFFSMRQGP